MISSGNDEQSFLLGDRQRVRSTPKGQCETIRCGKHTSLSSLAVLVAGVLLGALVSRTFQDLYHHDHTNLTRGPSPSSRHYTKFQAVGFQIYTGGAPKETSVGENPECANLTDFGTADGDIALQCYMGHANLTLDVQKRLEIMTDAVERAYTASDKSNDTLKVFVAPEFFFRGPNGAYIYEGNDANETDLISSGGTDNTTDAVFDLLFGLEKLAAQARFENWLFLFGTAVVSEALPVEDEWDYLFYNFGIILKGYDPSQTTGEGKLFLVPKRYVSNMDFLTPQRHTNDSIAKELIESSAQELKTENNNQKQWSPSTHAVLNPYDIKRKYYDRHMWHAYKQNIADLGYSIIEYGWFVMDGITFTVEICLDHDKRIALNTYLADAALGSQTLIPSGGDLSSVNKYVNIPRRQAQISLVSSADMTVSASALALANDGTIILQDGVSAAPVNMTYERECYTWNWHFEGGTEVIQRRAIVTPTEVEFQYIPRRGKKYSVFEENWKKSLGGVFSTALYEPKIVVYEPTGIAQ
uniref:Uncharacterized protein n=1 Tax=Grammatophora oceanica TaxID=210454 RepID=A0A7S1Y5N1_9STRA|mmetsp:Transcript_30904/g.45787  ORF Transcript_30904/g.45787 Transcript_30904/m.45787 type:complete len:526 (+) Transcript_30904:90-1667(+)|eukprot:CAMPEP_0194048868 /NCGR_PEP_ID=MMETSP0009_2-20130614/28799_1 /TAXON_ID=210454 /ORGANISM="Grammatophora oceanica, Strain CCMP 410" /LENGTH=525 /DNA_ID=CAMNT_0038694875 /DNA_START=63 /DNA_END=1640 /DNA_ORIENTATION=+